MCYAWWTFLASGTNCAPLLFNLFHDLFVEDYMQKLLKNEKKLSIL